MFEESHAEIGNSVQNRAVQHLLQVEIEKYSTDIYYFKAFSKIINRQVEMNQTDIFINPASTFQFLSVFNYLNTLGDIFCNQQLIKSSEQCHYFTIINVYFEYLSTDNETQIKRNLVQKLLEGSDLYGGNQNETLDLEYVDATFEFIISSIVFADYGNIYGYLAKIVNRSNNLTLSSLKEEIFDDLSKIKYLNPDGSVSKLSRLSSVKIRDNFLWPLFPQTESDMNVTDIDYVYAQAGLIFAQAAQLNLTNMTFNNFIMLSQTLELSVLQNTTEQSALKIFTLPALLFYASKEKEKFNLQFVNRIEEELLVEALDTLFLYLNKTFQTIGQEVLKSSPMYQFMTAMNEYKSRTMLAENLLRKNCHLNESEYESAVNDYKFYASSTKCDNISLPNVDEIFNDQINRIEEKYRRMLDVMIQDVLYEAQLVELINSTKTTVYESQIVPIPVFCFPSACPPYQPRLDESIYLFALRRDEGDFYYALINKKNNLSLLSYNDHPEVFLNELKLSTGTKFEILPGATILKRSSENLEVFVSRVARLRARIFAIKLHSTGYEKTFGERVVDGILALIPFYNCIRFAKAGNNVGTTFACIGDVISWIPFAGQMIKLGHSIGNAAFNHLLLATGVSVKTFVARESIRASLNFGLREIVPGIGGMVQNVILTKEMFKSLSIGLIRAVDPGFEFIGKLHWKGGVMLGNLFRKWTTTATKQSFPFDFAKFKNILQKLTKNSKSDESGMIPLSLGQMDGHDVFRYVYPGGEKPFGPKFVRLPNGNAELRRVIGFQAKRPVVVSQVTKSGVVYYRKLDLKTRETFGLEMKLNTDNVLVPVGSSFRKHITTIVKEGLSGRGRVIMKRENSIQEAVNMIARADPHVSRRSINSAIRHYILATERPIRENMANVKIDSELIENIDDVNPNTMSKYLGEELTVDPALNSYLITATYKDFALDWIRTKGVDKSYKMFYIHESVKLETLRSYTIYDKLPKGDLKRASRIITSFYGSNFDEMVPLDLSTILTLYDSRDARLFVTFLDYFGLIIYAGGSFTNGIAYNIKSHINGVLYTLAIKMADENIVNFPKKLFYLQKMTLRQFANDKTLKTGRFLTTNSLKRALTSENMIDSMVAELSGGNNVIVKYEVQIDSHFLALNLNRFIPFDSVPDIILPYTKFVIDNVSGDSYNIVVKMHNVPITKELWLVNIIKHVQMRIA